MKQRQANSEFGNPFKEQKQIFNYFKRITVIPIVVCCVGKPTCGKVYKVISSEVK